MGSLVQKIGSLFCLLFCIKFANYSISTAILARIRENLLVSGLLEENEFALLWKRWKIVNMIHIYPPFCGLEETTVLCTCWLGQLPCWETAKKWKTSRKLWKRSSQQTVAYSTLIFSDRILNKCINFKYWLL